MSSEITMFMKIFVMMLSCMSGTTV